MMSDMKEHFQTATNTVAAHNAAMLQEAKKIRVRVIESAIAADDELTSQFTHILSYMSLSVFVVFSWFSFIMPRYPSASLVEGTP